MIRYTDLLIKQTIYGTQVSERFLRQTKGLQQLISDTQEEAKTGFIRGLDGRLLPVRSPHSALNLRLQAGGAIYMKQYLLEIDTDMTNQNLLNYIDTGYVANIHDAVNIETIPEKVPLINPILVEGFAKASIALNLKYHVKGKPASGTNQWEVH